jgi:hypothetical protein
MFKNQADANLAGKPEENEHPMMRWLSGMIAYVPGAGSSLFAQAKLHQRTVALSTAESENPAVVSGTVRKMKALRDFIAEVGFECKEPTAIENDNQSCIAISKAKLSGSKTPSSCNGMVRSHFVRERSSAGA